jgi:3-polyprenyl-4-hydroxybenzoate decarboxylase
VVAKLEKFKVEMVNVIKGNAEIVALVDPQDGVAATVILPAVQDLATSVASGDFEVTAIALLPCAVSALDDSVDILTSISGDMAATIEAQVDLIALVN